jgi:hypothetical protein
MTKDRALAHLEGGEGRLVLSRLVSGDGSLEGGVSDAAVSSPGVQALPHRPAQDPRRTPRELGLTLWIPRVPRGLRALRGPCDPLLLSAVRRFLGVQADTAPAATASSMSWTWWSGSSSGFTPFAMMEA